MLLLYDPSGEAYPLMLMLMILLSASFFTASMVERIFFSSSGLRR